MKIDKEKIISLLRDNNIYTTDYGLDFDENETYFDSSKAMKLANKIIGLISTKKVVKKSFKSTQKVLLNRSSLEEKEWLLNKLSKRIEKEKSLILGK